MTDRILPLVAALLVAGCGPAIGSAQFGPAPGPRTRSDDVRIYSTRAPDCAYEELGVVTGPKPDLVTSLQRIVDAMKRRAAEMGGDALVGFRPLVAGQDAGGGSGEPPGYFGTVIRWTATCNDR